MNVRAVDGPIKGAKIYLDLNDNGVLDASEEQAANQVGTTAETGFASLTLTAAQAAHGLLIKGGIDTTTQRSFDGVLTAPQGSSVINPLTTLVSALMAQGKTLDEAKAAVSTALNISAKVDFLTFDTFAQSQTGDAEAIAAHKQAVVVANTIVAGAAALAGPGANDALQWSAVGHVVRALAAKIATTSGTLTLDAATLTEVLTVAAGTFHANNTANLESVAQSLVAANTLVTNATGDVSSMLNNVAKAQVLAQYTLVQAIEKDQTAVLSTFSENAPSVASNISLGVSAGDNTAAAEVLAAGTGTVNGYSVSVQENLATTQSVLKVQLTGAQGSVVFGFAGGADDSKFNLDSQTGEVRFKNSPDYETPRSAAWSNRYAIKVQASDAAGNVVVQSAWVDVQNTDDLAPIFALGATAHTQCAENVPVSQVVYAPGVQDNVGVTGFALAGGADDSKFSLDAQTGELRFLASPNYEIPGSAAGSNVYEVKIKAHDAAGNETLQTVQLGVTYHPLQASDVYSAWLQADTAAQAGDSVGAGVLQSMSKEIVSARDLTSSDGVANQQFPTLRLTQYVNAVTGTDVVSAQEYQAGFVISGHAAAGMQSSIKFRLDNDRTDGVNGQGAKVLSIGNNDVNADGVTDVQVNYNNSTGNWSLTFSAQSAAIKPATAGVWGSGIHQLVVDANGDGLANNGDASRLFLAAAGTAQLSDDGSVSKNFSVQDKITGDVFVYYAGDPDGSAGTAFWTPLNADTIVPDGVGLYDYGGINYYIHSASPSNDPSNLAMRMTTDIAAQVWEFHMAETNQLAANWSDANFLAQNHVELGSNTSRLASLQEMMALYAANFGQSAAGSDGGATSNVPGAVQALDATVANSGYVSGNDNQPGGWLAFSDGAEYPQWAGTATPSGHAQVSWTLGQLIDSANAPVLPAFVPVVL